MANLVAYARGTSFNLLVGKGGISGVKQNSAKISTAAGGLSGTVWDLTDSTQVKSVGFTGYANTSTTRAFSWLLRISPNYTGAPTASRGMFNMNIGIGTSGGYYEAAHVLTTGNINWTGKNEVGSNTFAAVSSGAWSPVSGTFYDLVGTWTGDTTASGAKMYVDGTLLGTGITASSSLLSTWDQTYWKNIIIGFALNLTTSAFKLDEFAIWDGVINPASVALESGTGSLNGSSRASLLSYTPMGGPQTYSRGRVVNK